VLIRSETNTHKAGYGAAALVQHDAPETRSLAGFTGEQKVSVNHFPVHIPQNKTTAPAISKKITA
jgi:hypothetical protein